MISSFVRRWSGRPFVALVRAFKVIRIRIARPLHFGTHDAAAYAVLTGGILRNIKAPYLLGSVIAAVQARMAGYGGVVLVEFGVASGGGLRQLASVASLIERHLDLKVIVIGFDGGDGLPVLHGAEDHPELWEANQFPMVSRDALLRDFESTTRRLVLGDIAATIGQLDGLDCSVYRLGFVSVDVDLYSSTIPILAYLGRCDTAQLVPAPVVHFDDVHVAWTYSVLAGEERAIEEFNRTHEHRHLDLKDRDLRLFALSCLDHPVRTGAEPTREKMNLVLHSPSAYF